MGNRQVDSERRKEEMSVVVVFMNPLNTVTATEVTRQGCILAYFGGLPGALAGSLKSPVPSLSP